MLIGPSSFQQTTDAFVEQCGPRRSSVDVGGDRGKRKGILGGTDVTDATDEPGDRSRITCRDAGVGENSGRDRCHRRDVNVCGEHFPERCSSFQEVANQDVIRCAQPGPGGLMATGKVARNGDSIGENALSQGGGNGPHQLDTGKDVAVPWAWFVLRWSALADVDGVDHFGRRSWGSYTKKS